MLAVGVTHSNTVFGANGLKLKLQLKDGLVDRANGIQKGLGTAFQYLLNSDKGLEINGKFLDLASKSDLKLRVKNANDGLKNAKDYQSRVDKAKERLGYTEGQGQSEQKPIADLIVLAEEVFSGLYPQEESQNHEHDHSQNGVSHSSFETSPKSRGSVLLLPRWKNIYISERVSESFKRVQNAKVPSFLRRASSMTNFSKQVKRSTSSPTMDMGVSTVADADHRSTLLSRSTSSPSTMVMQVSSV